MLCFRSLEQETTYRHSTKTIVTQLLLWYRADFGGKKVSKTLVTTSIRSYPTLLDLVTAWHPF
jgi:hypothetical protein